MEEETLFERLAHERDITVEEMRAIISAHIEAGMNAPALEKRVPWEWIPELGRYPRQRSGSGMRWSGLRPRGAAICCLGIRIFEYMVYRHKNSGNEHLCGRLARCFFLR